MPLVWWVINEERVGSGPKRFEAEIPEMERSASLEYAFTKLPLLSNDICHQNFF